MLETLVKSRTCAHPLLHTFKSLMRGIVGTFGFYGPWMITIRLTRNVGQWRAVNDALLYWWYYLSFSHMCNAIIRVRSQPGVLIHPHFQVQVSMKWSFRYRLEGGKSNWSMQIYLRSLQTLFSPTLPILVTMQKTFYSSYILELMQYKNHQNLS